MNPATEPVVLATVLAPLLTWLGARYGLDVSPEKATAAAGIILTIGAGLARSAVRTKRTLPDPDATKTGTVRVQPTTYRGGYESGDTPASELRPPSTGVRRPKPGPPQE